jgi:hypothetical protein
MLNYKPEDAVSAITTAARENKWISMNSFAMELGVIEPAGLFVGRHASLPNYIIFYILSAKT